MILNLQIKGYENGGVMPAKFATVQGGGKNVSPELSWTPAPAAKSYAILMDDQHPAARMWTHWIVIDIPQTVHSIAEGASRKKMPEGSRELITSWSKAGYDGPQPPIGSGNHKYVIRLYALDVEKLDVPDSLSRRELLEALEKHTIDEESWNGFFERC